MKKTMLAAAAVLALGSGAAHAAGSCPAFTPAVVKFQVVDNPIERDASKGAKEIAAAKGDGSDHWRYQDYSVEDSIATSRSVQMQQLPNNGPMCGALAEVNFKLSFKRKITVAKESADNACVEDAFASQAQPIVKAEDAAAAQFGNSLDATYGKDVRAIGAVQGADQAAVQAQIRDKLSALFNDKIYPAFEKQIAESHKSVNLADWQPADCNGETKKIVASLKGSETKVETPPANPNAVAPPVPQAPSYRGGK